LSYVLGALPWRLGKQDHKLFAAVARHEPCGYCSVGLATIDEFVVLARSLRELVGAARFERLREAIDDPLPVKAYPCAGQAERTE
jgi:hypothetical protein